MDEGQSEFFLCCVCHVGKTKRNTWQLQKLTQWWNSCLLVNPWLTAGPCSIAMFEQNPSIAWWTWQTFFPVGLFEHLVQ
jgi:hypothetical protein